MTRATLLAKIGAETFADSFAADNAPDDMSAYLEDAFSPLKQAQELAEPGSTFLIVEEAGNAVGYARLLQGPAPDCVPGSHPVEIVRIYTRADWIGKGVGSLLMSECLREAAESGCDTVWLGVWEHNERAVAFYEGWGLEKVGTHEFRLGTDVQTDWVMARPVERSGRST